MRLRAGDTISTPDIRSNIEEWHAAFPNNDMPLWSFTDEPEATCWEDTHSRKERDIFKHRKVIKCI